MNFERILKLSKTAAAIKPAEAGKGPSKLMLATALAPLVGPPLILGATAAIQAIKQKIELAQSY
jgi:hypothetical protein